MKNIATRRRSSYLKGRGAQINTPNQFLSAQYIRQHTEGLDEEFSHSGTTMILEENASKIINKVNSPDIPHEYSMNPYQGCEHGCAYCYARNTHQYWGYSAGVDFEKKIIVKRNAAELLEKELRNPNWEVKPIMLSGNTDCYQPVERKLQITRSLLKVMLKYRHPIGIITKNTLIARDMDILEELNKYRLVHVAVSITSLDEELRSRMEPRTAAGWKRMLLINQLASKDIPVTVMAAPMIPGLNDHELPEIMRIAALNGASSAAYTMVRLNGSLPLIFKDWLEKNYPDRASKVMDQIRDCHGGTLNDSRFGTRMSGEGNFAAAISALFRTLKSKYFINKGMPELNREAFIRTDRAGQLRIFPA